MELGQKLGHLADALEASGQALRSSQALNRRTLFQTSALAAVLSACSEDPYAGVDVDPMPGYVIITYDDGRREMRRAGWHDRQERQGKRVLFDLDRVGLNGPLSFARFNEFSELQRRALSLSPGDSRSFALQGTEMLFGVRSTKGELSLARVRTRDMLLEPIPNKQSLDVTLTFDLSKFLIGENIGDFHDREAKIVRVDDNFQIIRYPDAQGYLKRPLSLKTAAFRGSQQDLTELLIQAAK